MAKIPRRLLYYALTGSCEKPPLFAPAPHDPEIGDWVEWRHQRSTLRGTVRFLVPAGVESKTLKPEGVNMRRWRRSWDVSTFPRVVVEVVGANGEPIFFTVRPDPLNRFRVLRSSSDDDGGQQNVVTDVDQTGHVEKHDGNDGTLPRIEVESTPTYRVHHIENRKSPSLGRVIGVAEDLEAAKQTASDYAKAFRSEAGSDPEWMQFLPGVWCDGVEVVGYMKGNESTGAAIVVVNKQKFLSVHSLDKYNGDEDEEKSR